MELRVGNKYRLGRKIGSGSFGDIYLGECPRLQLRGSGAPQQLWGRGGGKMPGFEALKSELGSGAACFSHVSLGPPQVGLAAAGWVRQAGQRRVLSALLPAVGALGFERAWESPGWMSTLSPGRRTWWTERPGLLLAPARPLPGVRPPGFRAGRLGNDAGSPLAWGGGGGGRGQGSLLLGSLSPDVLPAGSQFALVLLF